MNNNEKKTEPLAIMLNLPDRRKGCYRPLRQAALTLLLGAVFLWAGDACARDSYQDGWIPMTHASSALAPASLAFSSALPAIVQASANSASVRLSNSPWRRAAILPNKTSPSLAFVIPLLPRGSGKGPPLWFFPLLLSVTLAFIYGLDAVLK